MVGTLRKLTYFADIQTAVNIQDELDREWVQLFAGLDERTGFSKVQKPGETLTEKSSIKINRDCMSCKTNMEARLNLFKVACLKYEANPVSYQN